MAEPVRINGVTALEMTMRDVLDNMEDMSCGAAYDSTPDCFEILSIEPPAPPTEEAPRPAAVVRTLEVA